jgi:uncharacterized protein YbcV (DUF1398 family)
MKFSMKHDNHDGSRTLTLSWTLMVPARGVDAIPRDPGGILSPSVIHEVLPESQAGKLVFPEVVRRLVEVGVESYFCDLATGVGTFYMCDGKTHLEKMTLPMAPIAEGFSSSELIAAIRGAQTDAIRYPEFVKRSTAAGVIAYWAFLTGRKVIYFGRKGEFHVEEFPRARS